MTPNDIRKAANRMIIELCPWEIDKNDTTEVQRTLFYICGLVDMAEEICKKMEAEQ